MAIGVITIYGDTIASENLTISATSYSNPVRITRATLVDPTSAPRAERAFLSVKTVAVHISTSGTNPSSATGTNLGLRIGANGSIEVHGYNQINKLRICSATGGAAVVSVESYA